jgi:hypothetical protein
MMMMMMMIMKSERVRRVCHVKGRQECIQDFVEMSLKSHLNTKMPWTVNLTQMIEVRWWENLK